MSMWTQQGSHRGANRPVPRLAQPSVEMTTGAGSSGPRARAIGSGTPRPGLEGQGRPRLWTRLTLPSSF